MVAKNRKSNAGFTFIEVMVAMVFMAIVIPVAVEGILIANRAGSVAERKRYATELADAKLTELAMTGEWRTGNTTGTFEDFPGFDWEMQTYDWVELGVVELSVAVFYPVQGQEFWVTLSTIVPEEEMEETTEEEVSE